MSLPNYPEYKTSGVEWLGEVPRGWAVRPLKHLTRLQTGMTPPTDDLGNYTEDDVFQWVRPEDLNETGTPTKASKFLTEQGWLKTRQITAGASLICCIGTIGKVGITNTAVSTNQQITAAVPREDCQYLFYAICSGRAELELASTGNVLRILNTERLGNISFPNPPLVEQTQIAAFLDCEAGKIDALIAEQRRLVELLAEKRQAVISHAVTKGLNPNAPMKDSGIEWLGEVPEDWEISRIKRICYINDGNHGEEYPSAADYTDETDGVPFIRAGNINRLSITSQDMLFITKEKNDSMRKGRLETGDILFTNRGEIGKIAVIPPEYKGANLNSQIAYLRSDESVVVSKYFAHYLTSDVVFSVYDSVSAGSVLTQFPIGDLKNIPAILPSISEQIAIATFLDTETAKFDTLTAEANRAIELLQERRSALISAAVTGKIDVREQQV